MKLYQLNIEIHTTLHIIWLAFQVLVAVVFIFPLIAAGMYLLFGKHKKQLPASTNGNYALIVTAYKYSGNLNHVIQSLLKLDYPHFHIYVVADDCNDYQYTGGDSRVTILYPNPPLKNQVKSHFMAIGHFEDAHNRIVIIDSDNLAHPGMLKAIDPYFEKGYEAVQGVRTAKNHDTVYAQLDAVNELYYLYYDRKVLFGIGSSCMLSGSGMAFTTDLYKRCLGSLDTEGAGFDKVLQKRIVSMGKRIAFAPQAIVYDEKTSQPDQLVKQRARWNNTWFRFFPYSLQLMASGLGRFSLNRFLFGFILFRPPLFLLLALVGVIMCVNVLVSMKMFLIWCGLCILFVLGFLWALYQMKAEKKLYMALLQAPRFILLQMYSLVKARKANQYSVATEHSYHKEIDALEKDNVNP